MRRETAGHARKTRRVNWAGSIHGSISHELRKRGLLLTSSAPASEHSPRSSRLSSSSSGPPDAAGVIAARAGALLLSLAHLERWDSAIELQK